MANYSHKKTVQESVHIKGVLSDDGTSILYQQGKDEGVADMQEILERYGGQLITFSLVTKDEEDLAE